MTKTERTYYTVQVIGKTYESDILAQYSYVTDKAPLPKEIRSIAVDLREVTRSLVWKTIETVEFLAEDKFRKEELSFVVHRHNWWYGEPG